MAGKSVKMKEINLTDKEKSMYSIGAITLIISFFLLVFIGSNVQNTITGNVIAGHVVLDSDDPASDKNGTNEVEPRVTQETALNALLQAESDIIEMHEQGFGIAFVNDTLIEAKRYFKGEDYAALLAEVQKIKGEKEREDARNLILAAQKSVGVELDYEKVVELTAVIKQRKQKAYELKDMIRASELRIEDFNLQSVDTAAAEQILATAVSEFQNERFEDVEKILGDVDAKLIELSAETTIVNTLYKAGRDNITTFVQERYREILLLLGSFLAIGILLYNRIMIRALRRKIKDMKVEIGVLEELMKRAQTDYFAKGDIPKQTFEIKMAKFKEKLVEIKQKLPVAETLLDKRLKSKRVL
jgi:hypothetical protein